VRVEEGEGTVGLRGEGVHNGSGWDGVNEGMGTKPTVGVRGVESEEGGGRGGRDDGEGQGEGSDGVVVMRTVGGRDTT
jgi:hypothetical protein